MCSFRVAGVGDSSVRYAHGVDAIQALFQALEGVRTVLSNVDRRLTWKGGEKGDVGFPRQVPPYYGLEFARRIDGAIDEAIAEFGSRRAT